MIGVILFAVIGVMSFVAKSNNWLVSYLGCNTKWSSLSDTYKGIDTYVHNVDQFLCSKKCKCSFETKTIDSYKNNSTLAPFFNLWTITEDPINSANEFYHCPNSTKDLAFSMAVSDAKKIQDLDLNKMTFYSYMSILEKKYSCSGFCNTTYYNTFTNSKMRTVKYLFTNINNGPPTNIGCMNMFTKDLPNYLGMIGSISIPIAGVLIIIFILTICLCCL